MNWEFIKTNIQNDEELKRIFQANSNYVFNCSVEQGLEMFRKILTKKLEYEKLDETRNILNALYKMYESQKIPDYRDSLTTLSVKLESFIRRVHYIIHGKTIERELANCLKICFRDFNIMSSKEQRDFFDRDDEKNPVFTPEHFRNVAYGPQFKRTYDLRNIESHLNTHIRSSQVIEDVGSILSVYLFITFFYFNNLKDKLKEDLSEDFHSVWAEFSNVCENFSKRFDYVLVTGSNVSLTEGQIEQFANIDWSLIVDFDTSPMYQGLMGSVIPTLKQFRAVVPIVKQNSNPPVDFPPNTTYWFKAKGSQEIVQSIPENPSYLAWEEEYSEYTRNLIQNYANNTPINRPIIVVVLSDEKDFVQSVLLSIKTSFSRKLRYVFLTQRNGLFSELIRHLDAFDCHLTFSQLAEGLRKFSRDSSSENKIFLPSHHTKGMSVQMATEDINKVQRYFHIIYPGIENQDDSEQTKNKHFYQGRVITWRELDMDVDVKREIAREVSDEIRQFLYKRSTGRVDFFHQPGAGGSTVARRIVMDFYHKYPCLLLHTYSKDAVDEIFRIYDLTDQPVLVLIDNININETQLTEMHHALEKRSILAVLFAVQKSFSRRGKYFMRLQILPEEKNRFIEKYSKEFPEFRNIYIEIEKDDVNRKSLLTPFYMGLIVFEKEYISLNKYVEVRRKNLNDVHRKILLITAFYSFFSKEVSGGLPSKVYNAFLKLNEDIIILQMHSNNSTLTDLLVEGENLHWRTLHPLISEEILLQEIGEIRPRVLNPHPLTDLSKEFIHILRNNSKSQHQETLNLLRNIFISRETESNSDMLDSIHTRSDNFSKLIQTLERKEYRFNVMEELVKMFQEEEPHFQAHLARLYYHHEEFEKAHYLIDETIERVQATQFRSDIYIFHHIKGMIYRAQAKKLSDQVYDIKNGQKMYKVDEYKDLFELASKQFEETRKSAPNKEHGYISYVQLVRMTIEFGFKMSSYKKEDGYTRFFEEETWYRSKLSEALAILAKLMWAVPSSKNSKNVQWAQSELLRYFNNPEQQIAAWTRIMNQPNVDRNSVRRNIVYAYMSKSRFALEKAKSEDLSSMLNNLNENMKERPSETDIRLWFQVARIYGIDIDELIYNLLQLQEDESASFYLYALYSVKVLNGSGPSLKDALTFLEKCRSSEFAPSHIYSPEWIGKRDDEYILLPQIILGEWDYADKFFKETPKDLVRLHGTICEIVDAKKGYIEVLDQDNKGRGLRVFYVPGSANHQKDDLFKKVSFYLGFNSNGARAYKVEIVHEEQNNRPKQQQIVMKPGLEVSCEVLFINEKLGTVSVLVPGVLAHCQISKYDLKPLSLNNLKKGMKLEAKVKEKSRNGGWNLVFKQTRINFDDQNVGNEETRMAKILREKGIAPNSSKSNL